jgi:hypothetical protein
MSGPDQAAQPSPRAQAHALAQELGSRGFTATVLRTHSHQKHPCVHIAARRGCHQAEYIYAAPAEGRWWFWWSTLDPIAPISDIPATAEKITRVFAPNRAAHLLSGTALPQPVMVPVLTAPPGQPRQASAERTSRAS